MQKSFILTDFFPGLRVRVGAISEKLQYKLLQKTWAALGPYKSPETVFGAVSLRAPTRQASKVSAS